MTYPNAQFNHYLEKAKKYGFSYVYKALFTSQSKKRIHILHDLNHIEKHHTFL